MRVTPLPIFGAKCKWQSIKRDKSTSRDFVARVGRFAAKQGSLRSPRGRLVASLPLRLCMRNKILRSANAKYNYSYLFFYKVNKGHLPLMYSFVVWCEFIDFGVFFGCYCLTSVTLFIIRSYLFYRKISKNNDIWRSQTSVFYFSYKVSTAACNATPTLLWES